MFLKNRRTCKTWTGEHVWLGLCGIPRCWNLLSIFTPNLNVGKQEFTGQKYYLLIQCRKSTVKSEEELAELTPLFYSLVQDSPGSLFFFSNCLRSTFKQILYLLFWCEDIYLYNSIWTIIWINGTHDTYSPSNCSVFWKEKVSSISCLYIQTLLFIVGNLSISLITY